MGQARHTPSRIQGQPTGAGELARHGGPGPGFERQFLESRVKAQGSFDEMLINGDTATTGFVSLDGLFKRLMEEGEK